MPVLAQVAVSDATLYYDKLYTYCVPAPLEGHIFVGSMVLAPFGRGAARPRIGVAIAIEECEECPPRTKELYSVAPEEARLTPELLAIVTYLKEAAFCTWFEAVKAVIPYGAQYKAVKTDEGWRLQSRLQRYTQTLYCLVPKEDWPPQSRKLSEKQQQVLERIEREGPQVLEDLQEFCGASRSVVNTLCKNGLLQTEKQDMPGLVGALPARLDTELPDLSALQGEVAGQLLQAMEQPKPKPVLLYGVTGSGKTPIFLHLVQAALDAGKTALILVPEIGLTPQMLGQLRQSFGTKVAVQHSGLSNTERLLQWRQVQRGEASVVVGTRSAVFAPLENIGIVVIDEEQEHTYQSESSPRFDALEVAKRRAAYHGALLLLASATPRVADFYAAMKGQYGLVQLPERFGSLPLPAVELVDMRTAAMAGAGGAMSEVLVREMQKNLQDGKQTILLLNRRGYRTVGMCRECGKVLKCTACSVPMVYHKAQGRMLCHYCGNSMSPAPEVCPECGGEMRYTGFGTQRVEEELQSLLPMARVLRMDMDTTQRKGAHEEMLNQFAKGEFDILLGTQMVAKGLDFERVSLVGVIGIDSLLFSQGYRAFESVFALVTQVVGRAGRAGAPGRALIQTVDPQNPVLNLAARQDYPAFYEQEIGFRQLALYPPFCTLCTVGFVAATEENALLASRRFGKLLAQCAAQQPGLPLRILGPAPMHVVQVAGSYRYRLTLKCRVDGAFRSLAKQVLEAYNKEGWPRKASVYLDFNSDGAD